MKISIIGGGGRVGSDAAFVMQMMGYAKELLLVDANADMAAGEALDLLHGSALCSSQKIRSGSYDDMGGSDAVVITAGLRRKPDESRLELINRNVSLFQQILSSVKGVKLPSTSKLFIVSNPVDILTHLAVESGILPENQVFGLGTVLDTCRFRSVIADRLNLNPTQVDALILGEHGDSMVPMWSSATVNGIPLASFEGYSEQFCEEAFDFTKKSGAEVIRLKGGAGRAVGVSIAHVLEAVALDTEAVLPISSLQKGKLGIKDICLSLPTRVGKNGVMQVIEPKVSDAEKSGLLNSAESLKSVLKQVKNSPAAV